MDAPNLFDEVDLALQVGHAVPGHCHGVGICSTIDGAAEALQRCGALAGSDVHAQDMPHPLVAQGDHRRGGRGLQHVQHAGHQLGPGEVGEQAAGQRHGVRRQLAGLPLLKPGARLGSKAQAKRGADDVGTIEGGGLKQHACRGVRHLSELGSEDAGNYCRLPGVGDHQVVGAKRALLAIERDDLLAVGCPAHHNCRPRQVVEIKGVQWLRGKQHHVVGDVHHVVDAAHTRGIQTARHPLGRRAHRDVDQHPGHVARAQVGGLHRQGDVVAHLAGAILRWQRQIERRKELARDGVHLARDAVNALAVATVGRELELEHGARRRQGIEDGSAGHEIIRQHKDAVALVGEFKLGGRAHHAEALDPAQFRLAQLLASGHHCTRNCHGHGLTGGHVGCAAHDLPGLVVSGVNAQHVQAIGIGVLIAGEHLAHKERLAVTRRIGDAAGNHLLNGGTGGREALGDLLVGKRCGDLLAQPLEGQLHENCSRKRRSPS